MRQRSPVSSDRLCGLVIALASGLSVCTSVPAADTASEASQLTALERQLDALDREADETEKRSVRDAARYHFDYSRLHADIARIRAGIRDYLTPPRAQPRDPASLDGQYRQEHAEKAP